MSKYDLTGIVESVRKAFKDDKKIGLGSDLKELTADDFIKLPKFWQDSTGTLGLPFGKLVLIAGTPDSGKSSLAIQATRSALEQDCVVIYAETEGKTTSADFIRWGVDPDGIILIRSAIAEEMYERLFKAWDDTKAKYPDAPVLVIIDSIGNIISQRDSEINLTEQNSSPGGKGKINRLGLNKMIAKMNEDNTAVLLISYTYDNMGSPGKTNSGGQALNFFSSLTYQTSRIKWLEHTEQGRKVRDGAEVQYTLFKNHINKNSPGEKKIVFRITDEGMEYIPDKGIKSKKEEEEVEVNEEEN